VAAPQPGGAEAPAEQPAAGEAPAVTPEPTPEAEAPAALPVDEGEPGLASIVLTGLTEDIQAGRTYPLVLTFERGGEVRFEVPVANPNTLREEAQH
jgi:hypothetical protein